VATVAQFEQLDGPAAAAHTLQADPAYNVVFQLTVVRR
jgi:hypothetical protein